MILRRLPNNTTHEDIENLFKFDLETNVEEQRHTYHDVMEVRDIIMIYSLKETLHDLE